MTAAALKEDRNRCLASGMDDYLTKPIQTEALAAAPTKWAAGATCTPADHVRAKRTTTQECV